MSTCQWTCRGCNASTYTPLRTPLQAQRCSSCLLWGSGNVTAQNSVGVSSESNLRRSEVKKRENCWEKQSDKQVTRPICFVGGGNHKRPLGRETVIKKMRKKLRRGKVEKLNLCFSEQMLAWRDYKTNDVNLRLGVHKSYKQWLTLWRTWHFTDLQQKMFHPGRWESLGCPPG